MHSEQRDREHDREYVAHLADVAEVQRLYEQQRNGEHERQCLAHLAQLQQNQENQRQIEAEQCQQHLAELQVQQEVKHIEQVVANNQALRAPKFSCPPFLKPLLSCINFSQAQPLMLKSLGMVFSNTILHLLLPWWLSMLINLS